jgi:hypothetical protein
MAQIRELTVEQAAMAAEQERQRKERDRLMAVRVALAETANTRGWAYMRQIAVNIVQGALQHSLNVEDETESDQYRVKARIAQQIFGEMFTVINSTLTFGTEAEPEWFSELNAFQQENEDASSEEIRS